ncbi:MAG: MutS-related protein [Salinarchaeum sp.]
MDLESYWGIGPKTRATLESSIGAEAAAAAIDAGDLRTLVGAGVDRGRATRILRRANSAAGMDLLATRDARSVYKELLASIAAHAVNDGAAARIRTLTPLVNRDAIDDRLAAIQTARESWQALASPTREAVLDAFETYDAGANDELAAVEAVVALHEAGATTGAFAPVGRLDPDGLADAATALAALGDDRISPGADDELDRLRSARRDVDDLAAASETLVEDLRAEGVRDTAGFREGLVEYLRTETSVDPARVRSSMPTEAMDATSFVDETLRELRSGLDADIEARAETVRTDLEADIEAVREDVDRAQQAIDTVAVHLSLARFADAYDLTVPTYAEDGSLAVHNARNLGLLEAGESVQPITYAVGDHGLDIDAPTGDRVTVLTGANSGGKTTLLETLCQVAILAHMGLPVPAAQAEVSLFDRIVFHRRHASFNAGVLESTLQSIVPPLATGDQPLMLVDEFEAITEPGRAADLLHGLVQLTVNRDALGAFVTHLADDLEPLPAAARIDGIFAEGLTADLDLEVDYQPRFNEVGRSTPEFIVSRLVAGADDRAERAAFETLAESVDTAVVQRTLADARWNQ